MIFYFLYKEDDAKNIFLHFTQEQLNTQVYFSVRGRLVKSLFFLELAAT